MASHIERAGPLHAPALAAIHAASFALAEQWTESAFASLLDLPGTFALIDPEGAFILARVAADEAEILTLAVTPALRRQGRARALLTHAARDAGAAGATALFLEVSDANLAARGLYGAAGFREVGKRRGYYASGETALVLRLELSPCAASGG